MDIQDFFNDKASKIQLALFDDKFLVDKNFSFDVIHGDEGLEYRYSFTESFEEKEHEILDLFTFLLKKTYDDPISYVEFTIEEYARYKGVNPTKLRRMSSTKPEDKNNPLYSNDIERLLYKMLNRNLIFKKEFIVNNGKQKKEHYKNLNILDQYKKTTDINDSRKSVYRIRIQKKIRNNLSNFVFLCSKHDYQIVINEYYRNPNLRNLYLHLGNILNILKNGQKDLTAFNDLCFILGYDYTKTRQNKWMITESINKLLPLDSLRGLAFSWKPTTNRYLYSPHFHLNQQTHDNLYNEKTIDKYKRLDTGIMTALSEDIMFSKTLTIIEKADITAKLNEVKAFTAVNHCFKRIFGKEASIDDTSLFMERFCYKDDYDNLYGSVLLKHIFIDGHPIIKTEFYNNVKLIFNSD